MANKLNSTGLKTNENSLASLEFLDSIFRGLGQVMLQNSSYAGALFLAGILYSSILFGAAAFVGAAIGICLVIFRFLFDVCVLLQLANRLCRSDDDFVALFDALLNGKLRGAGLDAFDPEPPRAENPLLRLDQVVVTPHAGGGVFDNIGNVARHAFANMLNFVRGEPIRAADLVIAAPAGTGVGASHG